MNWILCLTILFLFYGIYNPIKYSFFSNTKWNSFQLHIIPVNIFINTRTNYRYKRTKLEFTLTDKFIENGNGGARLDRYVTKFSIFFLFGSPWVVIFLYQWKIHQIKFYSILYRGYNRILWNKTSGNLFSNVRFINRGRRARLNKILDKELRRSGTTYYHIYFYLLRLMASIHNAII